MGFSRRARRIGVGIVGIAVVAVVASAAAVAAAGWQSPPEPEGTAVASRLATPRATKPVLSAEQPLTSSTPSGSDAAAEVVSTKVVVAIGDSIMDGHGVKPSHAWPELISAATSSWQLTDLASDGTGFMAIGDNDDTFQAQAIQAVALNPQIVIIAASSNDLDVDPDAVAEATTSTMTYLRDNLPGATIIALNTFWGDETPPTELTDLDADLRIASDQVGAHFLDIGQPLAGRSDLMQSDDVHPTSKGLVVLAAAIASAIRADSLIN